MTQEQIEGMWCRRFDEKFKYEKANDFPSLDEQQKASLDRKAPLLYVYGTCEMDDFPDLQDILKEIEGQYSYHDILVDKEQVLLDYREYYIQKYQEYYVQVTLQYLYLNQKMDALVDDPPLELTCAQEIKYAVSHYIRYTDQKSCKLTVQLKIGEQYFTYKMRSSAFLSGNYPYSTRDIVGSTAPFDAAIEGIKDAKRKQLSKEEQPKSQSSQSLREYDICSTEICSISHRKKILYSYH